MKRFGLAMFVLLAVVSIAPAQGYKAGVATQVITPSEPMWMAGYASRNKPCEVKQHDLWVKAVALEDAKGQRLIILTSDLCGFSRTLTDPIAAELLKRHQLPREAILFTVSHTHCGPVVNDNLADMYDMPAAEFAKIKPYTEKLGKAFIDVIGKAIADLKPASIAVGQGNAPFAVNRRQLTPMGVVGGPNPGGPTDRSVPVLRIDDSATGKIKAIVFGYACHNTTMQFFEWCGDYAGFAQIELEKRHPGAKALFHTGCGADSNPLPRSQLELCIKYGKQLADGVDEVLNGKMTPLTGTFQAKYERIALPFDTLPDPAKWKADLLSKQVAITRRAERMLKAMESPAGIPKEYPDYPVQVWKVGNEVLWVTLGGEVVVDYALRLKKELPSNRLTWVTGYANDVLAYIPSARVLKEGGYEADSSQIYYGHPTKWAPVIEDKIITKVLELAK